MSPSISGRSFLGALRQGLASLAFAIVSGLAASASLICVGLLVEGWAMGEDRSYPFTNGLLELVSFPSILVAALLLLPLSRVSILFYPASIVSFGVPYFVALNYEMSLSGGVHNLYPFEVLYVLVGGALLHIPLFLLRMYLVWGGLWPTARRIIGKG